MRISIEERIDLLGAFYFKRLGPKEALEAEPGIKTSPYFLFLLDLVEENIEIALTSDKRYMRELANMILEEKECSNQ